MLLGLGLPIGLNDKKGNPIHIGDTLRFDGMAWHGKEPGPEFIIELERGEILMYGCPDDMDQYCEIVKPYTELIKSTTQS